MHDKPIEKEADETVIVGGGPAGMLLAFLLVRGQQPVHVIERHPDFDREFRGEGIQLSVVRHLRDLGLMQTLLDEGIAQPAKAARIYIDDRPVIALKGEGDDPDFGIILHQAKFLAWMHQRLLTSGFYRATFSAKVESFEEEDGRAVAANLREGTATRTVRGRSFIVCTGRGTALRKRLGLASKVVDTHFNVLWLRLPRPKDESLVPDGFRAHLSGDALFILYTAADGGLQVAWSRRDEQGLKERSFEKKKALLLADAPPGLVDYFQDVFTPESKTHFLRVQSDRAERWGRAGVLLIGDAAHTMSPVAGQGINLAMRDAVVAANLLLAARAAGQDLDDDLVAAFQTEREPEVKVMQRFQRQLGYFMLGAPRWQVRTFFRAVLPVLGAVGIRQFLLKKVQAGVTEVQIQPVPEGLLRPPTKKKAA